MHLHCCLDTAESTDKRASSDTGRPSSRCRANSLDAGYVRVTCALRAFAVALTRPLECVCWYFLGCAPPVCAAHSSRDARHLRVVTCVHSLCSATLQLCGARCPAAAPSSSTPHSAAQELSSCRPGLSWTLWTATMPGCCSRRPRSAPCWTW